MQAVIRAIEYSLPERVLTNQDLANEYPDWTPERIAQKTGIARRHIAEDSECASDLAVAASEKLIESGACAREEIDYVIFCTQTPDYLLPSTACLMQSRLGLPTSIGAVDLGLGCSGYVYALGLAKGLVESEQSRCTLILTADTYSKLMNPGDRSVRTLFGDGAAATLVRGEEEPLLTFGTGMGPFVYGTDGLGAPHLIVPHGGARHRIDQTSYGDSSDEHGNVRAPANLYMNGTEVFAFSLREVPRAVERLLAISGMDRSMVDLFILHQANQYMLDSLRRKMRIPEEKFVISMRDCGNTVSASIPIALRDAIASGQAQPGDKIMLVGFGVGYSWGAALITLPESR